MASTTMSQSLQVFSNASFELAQKTHQTVGTTHATTLVVQAVDQRSTALWDCLHHDICRLLAECLDLVLGIVRHRRRATFQGGVCTAERFANGAVAGLDILAVDVDGWRRGNWFVDRHVLAQERSWGCGCGPGDPSFGIIC